MTIVSPHGARTKADKAYRSAGLTPALFNSIRSLRRERRPQGVVMNYVRFITPAWRVRRIDADCGPFGPAYDAIWERDVPEPLRFAIWQEVDWFNRNLPVPPSARRCVKSRKRWYPDGICWFVAEAREMIAHAFVLASLLRETGVPVSKVAAECPGTILYRDPWQVVAKPRRDERLLFA